MSIDWGDPRHIMEMVQRLVRVCARVTVTSCLTQGSFTRCLLCAGAAAERREYRPRKRPASASGAAAPAAKARMAAPAALPHVVPGAAPAPPAALPHVVPAALPHVVALPCAAPQAHVAAVDVTEAGVASFTDAVRQFSVVAQRLSVALEANTSALTAHTSALLAHNRTQPIVTPRLAEPDVVPTVVCPFTLKPLKRELDRAMSAGTPPSGLPILRASKIGTGGKAWACLAALLAVFYPSRAVEGIDTNVVNSAQNHVERWMRQGQLHQQVLTLKIQPVTLVQHIARHLRHDAVARARYSGRLLTDAATVLGGR